MKATSINIKDADLWRYFRVKCIEQNTTAGEIVEMLIADWLKKPTVKHGKRTR